MLEKIDQAQDEVQLLEADLDNTFEDLQIHEKIRVSIKSLLESLKQKDLKTYAHCLRVGISAQKIGNFLHMDEKALFFAGLLHDLGKRDVPIELLKKTDEWTTEDAKNMEAHVTNGYRAIKDEFSFTAAIIVLHHQFQTNKYPEELPDDLHDYSPQTKSLIMEHARILALADHYDALHRENSKFGETRMLNPFQIQQEMLASNPDKRVLIQDLYQAQIFLDH